MRTRLSTYARVNYPVDYELRRLSLMRMLEKRCVRGDLYAEKDGKLWVVIGDGDPDKSKKKNKVNPLL